MPTTNSQFVRLLMSVTLLSLFVGCGKDPNHIDRYPLKGTITHNGSKVPKGEIAFYPDNSKGNRGPSSTANINDGVFELPKERGIVGGNYKIEIMAFNGVAVQTEEGENKQGTSLLKAPYITTHEFPKEPGTYDHDIKTK